MKPLRLFLIYPAALAALVLGVLYACEDRTPRMAMETEGWR